MEEEDGEFISSEVESFQVLLPSGKIGRHDR